VLQLKEVEPNKQLNYSFVHDCRIPSATIYNRTGDKERSQHKRKEFSTHPSLNDFSEVLKC
jgi:hypothetical protein